MPYAFEDAPDFLETLKPSPAVTNGYVFEDAAVPTSAQSQKDYSSLDTKLSPDKEQQFQKWKAKYAPNDSGFDYDLRGAFLKGYTPSPDNGHFPDEFKKPNHPTFSNQSKFAKDYPELAGSWAEDNKTYLPPKPSQKPLSFIGEMGQNVGNAVQSAKDLLSGNYEVPGRTVSTPKTEALADKLFPAGSDGSFVGALRNLGNTRPSDFSGALLEKFGATPAGKALSIIGGINPVYNAAGTALNRYVNPAIEKYTGIAPDNLALMEMALPIAGVTKAGKVTDPTANLIKKAYTAATKPKQATATAADLAAQSSAKYTQAKNLGASITPVLTDNLLNHIEGQKFKPIAGKVLTSEESAFNKSIDEFKDLRGQPLSLEDAQRIDEALGNKIDGMLDNGRVTKDARKVIDIQDKFRDMIKNAGPSEIVGSKAGLQALNEGRNLWSRSARMRDVEKIISRAEMMDNPVTGIKTGFRTLASNQKRLRGFTKQERALINKAAKTGIVTDALRVTGSRLGPIAAGAAGYATGGPIGAVAAGLVDYGLSSLARGAANKIQMGKANKVRSAIANGPQANTSALPALIKNGAKAIPNSAADAFLAALMQQQSQQAIRGR